MVTEPCPTAASTAAAEPWEAELWLAALAEGRLGVVQLVQKALAAPHFLYILLAVNLRTAQ